MPNTACLVQPAQPSLPGPACPAQRAESSLPGHQESNCGHWDRSCMQAHLTVRVGVGGTSPSERESGTGARTRSAALGARPGVEHPHQKTSQARAPGFDLRPLGGEMRAGPLDCVRRRGSIRFRQREPGAGARNRKCDPWARSCVLAHLTGKLQRTGPCKLIPHHHISLHRLVLFFCCPLRDTIKLFLWRYPIHTQIRSPPGQAVRKSTRRTRESAHDLDKGLLTSFHIGCFNLP